MATVVRPDSPAGGRALTVGVALSATELCAVRRGAAGAGVWRLPLQPLNGDGSGWPALTAALNELSRTLGTNGGRLEVALMPPLTEIRRLDLPPMRESELRMLLSRNAARYFVGARAAQLVGTSPAPPRASSPPGGVMAAAVAQRLVAALHAAAREAGWTVDSVSPAEGAWCAAAAALWPAAARQDSTLLVCAADRTELLLIERGRLAGVRRFRGGAEDAALVAEAIGGAESPRARSSARVGVVGASEARDALTRALAGAGYAVSPAPAGWSDRAGQTDVLAAEFAGPHAEPLLRSEATLASRREHLRRVVSRLAAASVVLLLAAAALKLWGEKRELRALQADRAAIKPLISATLVGRTSVETAFRQLAALAATERSAPRWSAAISDLGVRLDANSYLTSLRARDDSVVVEGVAVSAARAFDSMVQTPGLAAVRAAAPVRRESPQGAPARERFSIAAVVARPAAPATAPAAAAPPATAARKAAP